jgi:hypothetical protein
MTTDKIAVRKSMAPRREKRLLCEIDVMVKLSTKGNTIGQSLPKTGFHEQKYLFYTYFKAFSPLGKNSFPFPSRG